MKFARNAALLASLFSALAGCTTPSTLPPAPLLQQRLAPAWIADAQRIESGDRTIYFRGTARGARTGAGWAGVIHGDILALDPALAIVIPAGSLALSPRQELKITGPQHVITSDAPAWRELLRR